MRALPAIAIAALLLPPTASAAPTDRGYDKAAIPAASIALQEAQEQCQAWVAAREIKTHSELAACNLVADRVFFSSINLKKMDVFETYAAGYQALAADRDAGRVSERKAGHRANNLLARFYGHCDCDARPGGFGAVPGAVSYDYNFHSGPPPAKNDYTAP